MPGVYKWKMDDIQFKKIELTNNAILAFIKINGKLMLPLMV
jgi:hypothetical protein